MKKPISFNIDTDYHQVAKSILPNYKLSEWIDSQIKMRVIDSICQESILMCSFEDCDLTKGQEASVIKNRTEFNALIHRPKPASLDLQPWIDRCIKMKAKNGTFEECLRYAIAQWWASKAFENDYDILSRVTFYLECWI